MSLVGKELDKLKGKNKENLEEELELMNKLYAGTLPKTQKPNKGENEGENEEYEKWVANFKEELELMSKIWDNLWLSGEDERQLDEKAKFLESAIKEATTKGFDSAIPDMQKLLKDTKFKLNLFEENREADSNAQEDYKANQDRLEKEYSALIDQLKEDKKWREEEEKAVRAAQDALRDMGQSLYQAADILKSEFLSSLSNVVNSMNSMVSSFSSLSKSLGGLGGGISSMLPQGMMSGLSSILGIAGGALGMVGSAAGMAETVATSVFGGKTSADISKKNEQQKEIYKKNTDALKTLGEKIAANTQKLEGFTMSLIANLSKSPTMSKISTGNAVFDNMIDAMMDDKNFGQVSAIKKGSKRNWYGKKKS
ncbi:MAG: hypothetical protein ACRCZH_08330, partial [Cetobacterium sp.]